MSRTAFRTRWTAIVGYGRAKRYEADVIAAPYGRPCGAVAYGEFGRAEGVYIGNLGYIPVMHEERDASSCGPLCRDKVFLMDKLGCTIEMLAPLDV